MTRIQVRRVLIVIFPRVMRSTRTGWLVQTRLVIMPVRRIRIRFQRRVTVTRWSVVTVRRIPAIILNMSVHSAMRGIGVAQVRPRIIGFQTRVLTVIRGLRRVVAVRQGVRTVIFSFRCFSRFTFPTDAPFIF